MAACTCRPITWQLDYKSTFQHKNYDTFFSSMPFCTLTNIGTRHAKSVQILHVQMSINIARYNGIQSLFICLFTRSLRAEIHLGPDGTSMLKLGFKSL